MHRQSFLLLYTELYYRYVVGMERLHIGRLTLARPRKTVHDEVAASLQPCVVPGETYVQALFETQGRGFVHGHGKGHSIITPSMKWLRNVSRDLAEAARSLRQSLLSTAATVQYEAANEPARQKGMGTIAPEPFTESNNARVVWMVQRIATVLCGNTFLWPHQ